MGLILAPPMSMAAHPLTMPGEGQVVGEAELGGRGGRPLQG